MLATAALELRADDELTGTVRVAAAVAGVPHATLTLLRNEGPHRVATAGSPPCTLPHLAPGALPGAYLAGFHAAVPLTGSGGRVLGSLCVSAPGPARPQPAQLLALEDLARLVVTLLEQRHRARLSDRHAAEAEELRDLAEIVMAEAEARGELNEVVTDTIDVAVVVAGPDGRLTNFNRTARIWHGRDADPELDPERHPEVHGMFQLDGVTPMPARATPLQRALREGSVDGLEIVLAPPGRAPRTVICSARAMSRIDGTSLGAVVAMADVTADRAHAGLAAAHAGLAAAHAELAERSELLAAAVSELERSNAELGQFAGIASHDLRSPLMVVTGYVEMLAEEYGHLLDEQGRDWIATALKGTARMHELITALLAYAQAGGSGCRRKRTDSGEVCSQAVLDLRAAIREAGAQVVVRDLPELFADPVLLRQLLQNLIGNAVKYRDPGRPCQVLVTARAGGEEWTFSVADNGTGIPAELREEVFGMFVQVDPSARTGHGIGLATCQRIVERHGGRIWVEETPGGGTTVRFTLPQRPGRP
ncbi:hypothetical protein NUM3379_08080 [Kineococcus sp. NUM-3379]